MEDHDQQREVHNYISLLMETTSMEKNERIQGHTEKERMRTTKSLGFVSLIQSVFPYLPTLFFFLVFL